MLTVQTWTRGFVDTTGTITTIDFPGVVGTVVADANSSGHLSGY